MVYMTTTNHLAAAIATIRGNIAGGIAREQLIAGSAALDADYKALVSSRVTQLIGLGEALVDSVNKWGVKP